MSYYLEDELKALGFRSLGEGIRLSRKASVYGAQRISIGSYVRIDDFCVLSAVRVGCFWEITSILAYTVRLLEVAL